MTPRERLHAYMKGWKDGASARPFRTGAPVPDDYAYGYETGTAERLLAQKKAQTALGVTNQELDDAVLR